MELQYHPQLSKVLLGIEGLVALVALVYLFKLRDSYWKWFCVYLLFIFLQECYFFFNDSLLGIAKQQYYAFVGIPIQYLFWFWLYAFQSLQKKTLYFLFTLLYIATYFPTQLYREFEIVYSLNLTIGTLLLTVLVVLEFRKQIVEDNILLFSKNKMFYITVGCILFYIGTYPFYAFYRTLATSYVEIWNMYYLYSILANCAMYLLFIASFLWGKHPLK